MIAAAMPKPHHSARHGGALKLHRGATFGEVSIAPHQPQSLANPPIVRTGTALAINYLTSGVVGISASSTGRGGAINLEAALAYVLKGASPDAASRFSLERLEPGGRVIGKRCGTSQNIGAKARKAKD